MDEKVTVTVDDDHVDQLDTIAERCTAMGMDVHQVLGAVGIITGSVPSESRAALERLPGVTAVESERTFQIDPPEADVQ